MKLASKVILTVVLAYLAIAFFGLGVYNSFMRVNLENNLSDKFIIVTLENLDDWYRSFVSPAVGFFFTFPLLIFYIVLGALMFFIPAAIMIYFIYKIWRGSEMPSQRKHVRSR